MNAISAAFSPLSAIPFAPVNAAQDDAGTDAAAAKSGQTPFAGVLADRMKPKSTTTADNAPTATDSSETETASATDGSATDGQAVAGDASRSADAAPPTRGRDATAALRAMVEQVAVASTPTAPNAATGADATIAELTALEVALQSATTEQKKSASQDVNKAESAAPDPSTSNAPTEEKIAANTGATNDAMTTRAATEALRRAAEMNPTIIVRDTNTIDPELKAKVDRVIARMREETGHEVTVAESWRSQSRQNALHAQGRTATGPVVTWTRHSLHTEGAAVDVMIDGKFDNAEAYRQLRTIAGEEGLHTLGARDPGHLELLSSKGLLQMAPGVTINSAQMGSTNGSAGTPSDSASQLAATLKSARNTIAASTAPTVDAAATVATVARVATVASVAEVAGSAPVVRVMQSGAAGRASAAADDSTSNDTRRSTRTARSARQSAVLDAFAAASGTAGRESGDVRMSADPTSRLTGTTGLSVPTAARAVDAGARVAQVFGLQDAKAAQPMSSMLLRLDNGAGGEDRIRVDLRGTTVGASIDMRDADAAQALAKNLPDLTRSLEARGLDTGALRVRAIAASGLHEDGLLHTATINTDAGRTRADALSTTPGSSARSARDDAQHDGPKHQPSRQRSRRDQKGEPQ